MRIIIISLILVFYSQTIQAQSWDEFENDIRDSGKIGANLYKSIVSPTKETQKKFLIGTGISALAILADNSVRSFTLKNQSNLADKVFKIDSYYGSTYYMIGGPLLLYAGGFFSGNKEIKEMGLHSLQAYLYTGILTMTTKIIAGRSRPFKEKGPYSFDPFSMNFNNRSFFSGHTSTVFAISTVMAAKIDNVFWKIAWYGAAILVSGARIYHDKHWLSDVIAGAIVGYSVGRFVVNQNSTSSEQLFSLSPSIQNSGITLLHLTFPL